MAMVIGCSDEVAPHRRLSCPLALPQARCFVMMVVAVLTVPEDASDFYPSFFADLVNQIVAHRRCVAAVRFFRSSPKTAVRSCGES